MSEIPRETIRIKKNNASNPEWMISRLIFEASRYYFTDVIPVEGAKDEYDVEYIAYDSEDRQRVVAILSELNVISILETAQK